LRVSFWIQIVDLQKCFVERLSCSFLLNSCCRSSFILNLDSSLLMGSLLWDFYCAPLAQVCIQFLLYYLTLWMVYCDSYGWLCGLLKTELFPIFVMWSLLYQLVWSGFPNYGPWIQCAPCFNVVSEDNCVIGGIYFCIFIMMQQLD